MGYWDDKKLKEMKNLNEKSATFVVYTTEFVGVRDKIDGDTHISGNLFA
jgi:hypothetical protein